MKELPNSWPILEIFGPTVQGEGALAGQKSHFVRLAICNDRCTWCDTKYSWNRKQATEMSVGEIASRLTAFPSVPWITLSGGNPGIWPNLNVLIRALRNYTGSRINVETQGTVFQKWMAWDYYGSPDMLTVSPKPPSSSVRFRPEIFEQILANAPGVNNDFPFRTVIKVVIFNEEDYQWFKNYIWGQYSDETLLRASLPRPIYLQAGTPQDDIEQLGISGQQLTVCRSYEWLCDRVLKDEDLKDVVVLPQLHVLAFGHKRET